MQAILIKLKTIRHLGLVNILVVIFYRLRIRFGIHAVCRISGKIPNGPYFNKSNLPISGLPTVSDWNDSLSLFSNIRIPLDKKIPEWLTNPITGNTFNFPLNPWWKISDFDVNVGDIKLIWELSRMDWVLALAQRVRNGDDYALVKLNGWLADWLDSNRPYLGPNWKCGQEASIRVIHLFCAAMILGQDKHSLPALQELIKLHLRRIAPTIDYAIAQNNNHGTSEAAALFIGGAWLCYQGEKEGRKWEKVGRRWLEDRAKKLIAGDGSFSQYSLNYHRMALDTFSIVEICRKRFDKPPFSSLFYTKSALLTSWLYQMISSISGDGPNLGANDGARLLPLTDSDYRDYRPSVHLAMALFKDCRAYQESGLWNLHLSWLDISEQTHKPPCFFDCNYDEGGYKILRVENANVFFRFPRFSFRPSQADALHVDLWVDGHNILADAGTLSYNSSPDMTWYFSGTVSHNTIEFDGRDQMPKLGRFLFGNWLKTKSFKPINRSDTNARCSAGYFDFKGVQHFREVILSPKSLCVIDEVSGFDEKAILRWRLPNGIWNVENAASGVTVSGEHGILTVNSDVAVSSANLVEGWKSLYYLEKTAATVLEIEINRNGKLTTMYKWFS
jgi:hypothetical protein